MAIEASALIVKQGMPKIFRCYMCKEYTSSYAVVNVDKTGIEGAFVFLGEHAHPTKQIRGLIHFCGDQCYNFFILRNL